MRSTRTTWPSCFVLVMLAACARADDAVAPAPRPYPEHLQWWAEARFGIFVHWGPVSLKGTEISWSRANTNPECPNRGPIPAEEYDNLYKSFNPVRFDADEWIGIARAAGAKYLVLTAKHCDGFLLWHSQTSDYHIGQTPFQRDVCAELVQAARRQQFRIGWYFSPMDWRDPDFRTERNADFLNRMRGQLREVLANYGPIDLLWFDWDGGKPVYDQPQTYAIVNSLQPQIVVNNRLDLGPGNSDRQILSPHANYYTPEQTVGAYDDQQPWESCMTTSRRWQWAWGGNEDGVKGQVARRLRHQYLRNSRWALQARRLRSLDTQKQNHLRPRARLVRRDRASPGHPRPGAGQPRPDRGPGGRETDRRRDLHPSADTGPADA